MSIESLVADYGLLAIAVGCYLEGESVLLLGGIGAQQGWLPLPGVVLAGVVGAVFGDQLYFHLGRRLGVPAFAARPRLRRVTGLVAGWIERRGDLFLIGFRFLYGLRIVSPLLLGTGRVSAWRFTSFDLLGSLLWAVTVAGLGFAIGGSVASSSEWLRIAELLLLVGVGLLAVVLWWRRRGSGAARGVPASDES